MFNNCVYANYYNLQTLVIVMYLHDIRIYTFSRIKFDWIQGLSTISLFRNYFKDAREQQLDYANYEYVEYCSCRYRSTDKSSQLFALLIDNNLIVRLCQVVTIFGIAARKLSQS